MPSRDHQRRSMSVRGLFASFLRLSLRPPARVAAVLALASPASAGTLFSPMVGYSIFSFDSQEQEKTPNYHGYIGQVTFGYSFFQFFDAGLFINYTAGSHGAASLESEDARLINYGGILGIRLEELVGINVNAARSDYLLLREHNESAIKGHWQGLGFGVGLSMIFKVTRTDYLQLETHIQRARMQAIDDAGTEEERGLSSLSVGFSYVFNEFHTLFTEAKLFKGII